MGQCNYCSMKQIRARAKDLGESVTVLQDAKWGMGGVNVYVHPKEINIRTQSGGEDGPRARYRVSWMMEIPSRCACDS